MRINQILMNNPVYLCLVILWGVQTMRLKQAIKLLML